MKTAKTKYVIEAQTTDEDISVEDGGCAKILFVAPTDGEDGIFARIQSWYENPDDPKAHQEINQLLGKRVRITIEVIE